MLQNETISKNYADWILDIYIHMKTSREERSKSIFEKNELWCFSNRRIQPEHSGGNRLKIFQF